MIIFFTLPRLACVHGRDSNIVLTVLASTIVHTHTNPESFDIAHTVGNTVSQVSERISTLRQRSFLRYDVTVDRDAIQTNEFC